MVYLSGCLLLVVVVSGCASPLRGAPSVDPRASPGADQSASQGASADAALAAETTRSRLIVADFVEALGQIDGLGPHGASLRVLAPGSRFGQFLIAGLQDAGYDLRLVASPADGVLDYHVTTENVTPDGSGVYTFLVSAESVKLKRSYQVDAQGIRPSSSMFVHGASARGIRLDDTRFDRRPGQQRAQAPLPVPPGGVSSSGRREQPTSLPSAVSSPTRPEGIREQTVVRAIPPAPDLQPSNFYETGQSRYARLLDAYSPVQRHVLVFPNDSLILGSANKQVLQSITRDYDASQDVISVIGCSHGTTALDNGNEVLANGRASRIKEEFVRAGIDPARVLEEGCWAGTHFDAMPARGVVVTLQRRAG